MASQYIVVVGCGRLGSILASRLSSQGNSVVVIDPYESSFNNLSSDFSGFQITGDASEIEVLRSAKVDAIIIGAEDFVVSFTGYDTNETVSIRS